MSRQKKVKTRKEGKEKRRKIKKERMNE